MTFVNASFKQLFRFQIWQNEQQRFQGQPQLPSAPIATALTRDFFDAPTTSDGAFLHRPPPIANDLFNSRYAHTPAISSAGGEQNWADEFSAIERQVHGDTEWVKDFEEHKANQGEPVLHSILSNGVETEGSFPFAEQNNDAFNKQFWDRLQDEWKKISDRVEDQPPWLSEFSEYYDPYKVTSAIHSNRSLLLKN